MRIGIVGNFDPGLVGLVRAAHVTAQVEPGDRRRDPAR
jgi:hypothetical protein